MRNGIDLRTVSHISPIMTKPLPTLILSLIVSVGMAGCNSKPIKSITPKQYIHKLFEPDTCYQMRIQPLYCYDGYVYQILFRNHTYDNWQYLNWIDNGHIGSMATENKSYAIYIAKRLTSYETALKWQDSISKKYRQIHDITDQKLKPIIIH